jgi:hypothetical protein
MRSANHGKDCFAAFSDPNKLFVKYVFLENIVVNNGNAFHVTQYTISNTSCRDLLLAILTPKQNVRESLLYRTILLGPSFKYCVNWRQNNKQD